MRAHANGHGCSIADGYCTGSVHTLEDLHSSSAAIASKNAVVPVEHAYVFARASHFEYAVALIWPRLHCASGHSLAAWVWKSRSQSPCDGYFWFVPVPYPGQPEDLSAYCEQAVDASERIRASRDGSSIVLSVAEHAAIETPAARMAAHVAQTRMG
jgi:hypothetical protein